MRARSGGGSDAGSPSRSRFAGQEILQVPAPFSHARDSSLRDIDLLTRVAVRYSTATVIASPRTVRPRAFAELSALTGLKTFVTSFAGHIAEEASRQSRQIPPHDMEGSRVERVAVKAFKPRAVSLHKENLG